MNFLILKNETDTEVEYEAFSSDYRITGTNSENVFKIKALNCDESFYIKADFNEIYNHLKNDILKIKKDKNDDNYVLLPMWDSKYFSPMDSEKLKKFVYENFQIPMQFIDSVEESELLMKAAQELIKNYEKACLNKNF